MFFDFQKHFSTFLKKTVQQKKEKLRIRDVRVFEYSEEHIDEVWAKYYDDVQGEWHKFTIEKKRLKKHLVPFFLYLQNLQVMVYFH